jgi:hypothetical protein
MEERCAPSAERGRLGKASSAGSGSHRCAGNDLRGDFRIAGIADAVKSALASLQIPMLKAAMFDSGLFWPMRIGSPTARQDGACRGRVAVRVSSRHPLCVSISRSPARRAEFRTIPSLSEPAAELDS